MSDDNRLDEIIQRLEKMEALEKAKELEGDISTETSEPESQMFTISRDVMDIVGEADALLTKTRFDSVDEAERAIEPFITRLYAKLERTRLGGWGVFLPIEQIEDGKIDLREYTAFEINETPIDFLGVPCLETYIEVASVRARLMLKARISLGGGKARLESIHQVHGDTGGLGYLEDHTPAPPMYMEKYTSKQPVNKVDIAAKALIEEE